MTVARQRQVEFSDEETGKRRVQNRMVRRMQTPVLQESWHLRFGS